MRKSLSLHIAIFASLCFAFIGHVFSQTLITPRPASPAAEVKQRIGLTDITVNYSRPTLTRLGVDRTGKIWGELVPYEWSKTGGNSTGKMPWRAGANENTTIRFSDDVKIQGKDLAAGIYGLHMLIHKGGTATIIFSKNHTSWGSFFYKADEDSLRVEVKTRAIPKTEVLTYSFVKYGTNFTVLALDWEMKRIPIRIESDVNKIVFARFRKQLRSMPELGWQGFATAANYCLSNKVNLEEGLKWANEAITRHKGFDTLRIKGRLLYLLGKVKRGDSIITEALALGDKDQIKNAGDGFLRRKRFYKAIEFFMFNAAKNPKDPNMFDSLGEAYKIAGDRKNAIRNLKKVLTMNPSKEVKVNSEKLLKELGAN